MPFLFYYILFLLDVDKVILYPLLLYILFLVILLVLLLLILLLIIFFVDGNYILSLFSNIWKSSNSQLFYDTDKEWCKELRDNHEKITEEFINYQKTHNIPILGKISEQEMIFSNNEKPKWKVAVLKMYGEETNLSEHFPFTLSIIKKIPKCHLCMFSVVDPQKKIPLHQGINACVLRYHLGLIIPKQKELCTLTLENEKVFWEKGKDIMFDDTFVHMVHNNTDEERVVLFLDIQKEFKNPIFNLLNDILFYIAKKNSTVLDIYKKINKYNIYI